MNSKYLHHSQQLYVSDLSKSTTTNTQPQTQKAYCMPFVLYGNQRTYLRAVVRTVRMSRVPSAFTNCGMA